MRSFSVAISENLSTQALAHLIRSDGQEDVCFALWAPSTGRNRDTAILTGLVLPERDDRAIHGNATFTSDFVQRAIGEALKQGAGLALIHSHPFPGWQGMSADDIETELRLAGPCLGATGMSFIGLTVGNDGTWSARSWLRSAPGKFVRRDAESVRVVGSSLKIDFHPTLRPTPMAQPELERTISAWGPRAQADIARTRIGIIGLGSVGSIVAEGFARTGLEHLILMDHDVVEFRNLDRMIHATRKDALNKRLKVDVVGDALDLHSTASHPNIERHPNQVQTVAGYRAALDCDLLVCAVDRPWPRHILNVISQAHLIPVIDAGINVRTAKGQKLVGASWRAINTTPGCRCLECYGQYDIAEVSLERSGQLDDPHYIAGLPDGHRLRGHENVAVFSFACAGLQLLQAMHKLIKPSRVDGPSVQTHHFVTGNIDCTHEPETCEPHCQIATYFLQGDAVEPSVGLLP